jgi:hypothetical protein
MLKRHLIISILIYVFLTSCNDNSTNSKSQLDNKKEVVTLPSKETVDNNFNDFLEKFSTDSAFQISRTKFPLKINWYDIENDNDSLIYKDVSDFEMMDFRKKKSSGQYDQWEQKIVVDKNNKSAKIKIRGIENGIMVDYLFEKINGIWMIIGIEDRST